MAGPEAGEVQAEPLSQLRLNKVLVLGTLYFGRVYRTSRLHFESKFQQPANEASERPSPSPPGKPSGGWAWAGFPRLWPALIYYEHVTNFYMAYLILRNLAPEPLKRLIGLLQLELAPHCYLLGRFIFHESIAATCATLFSICHFAWRSLQAFAMRPYSWPAFQFMLIAERDLKQFARLLNEHNERWTDAKLTLGLEEVGGARQRLIEKQPLPDGQLFDLDLFFKQTLCYKVEFKGQLVHRMRPNRTLGARRALQVQAYRTVLVAGSVFLLTTCIVLSGILHTIPDQARYLHHYPNCSRASGYWIHRPLAGIMDFVESVIIWFDSGAAISLWAILHLINYDNVAYWAHLDRRLNCLYARVRLHHQAQSVAAAAAYQTIESAAAAADRNAAANEPSDSDQEVKSASLLRPKMDSFPSSSRPAGGWNRRHAQLKLRTAGQARARRQAPLAEVLDQSLEADVFELQAQFYDFFAQIDQTDVFISDIITSTLMIWLLVFSIFGHLTFRQLRNQPDLVATIYALEQLSFLVVTVGSFSLFRLHHNCLRSYTTICSLMAYDQSKHKRGFLRLMEFYTVRKRSAYTLFQQYPYTVATYLSLLGWSLSCFFILDGMLAY